jgi:hypothetical protein
MYREMISIIFLTINRTKQSHQNFLCGSLNVRYFRKWRRSRRNSLLKMKYKIVKRKSLRTQSFNIPNFVGTKKSHKRDSSPNEKTKGQTSLLLGQTTTLFHSFFLPHHDTSLSLSLSLSLSCTKKSLFLCAMSRRKNKKVVVWRYAFSHNTKIL